MCFVPTSGIVITEKPILVYKKVRKNSDGSYESMFLPGLRAWQPSYELVNPQKREGQVVELGTTKKYKIKKVVQSSFSVSAGLYAYTRKPVLVDDSDYIKVLTCRIPKGTKVIFGKENTGHFAAQSVLAERLIPLEEIA